MSTATRSKQAQRIDDLMERASEALVGTKYFECERCAAEALRLAHAARDYERMARILMPLQEARRQKRLAAVDAGRVHVLDSFEEAEQVKIKAGCWLIQPPLVGAHGRDLRDRADRAEIPALVIVREPTTALGECPIVMIGPVTVRTKVAPPEQTPPSAEWMLEASEALGDAAIEHVDATALAAVRVDKLIDRLGTVPEHEKLHQALEAACHEAMAEAAAEAAAPRSRRKGGRGAEVEGEGESDE